MRLPFPKKPYLRSNQFGGVKGKGTEHLLVNLWQKILENIEDSRAACLLTSIDYEKHLTGWTLSTAYNVSSQRVRMAN